MIVRMCALRSQTCVRIRECAPGLGAVLLGVFGAEREDRNLLASVVLEAAGGAVAADEDDAAAANDDDDDDDDDNGVGAADRFVAFEALDFLDILDMFDVVDVRDDAEAGRLSPCAALPEALILDFLEDNR